MKELTILGITAFAALLFAPAAVISAPAGPPEGLDVNIVNPLPVPVTVDGQATITGDVNVVNTPDVNVTNTPTVTLQDDRVRVQGQANDSYLPGDPYWAAEYGPVETGKTLVVEYLNVSSTLKTAELDTATGTAPPCNVYVLNQAGCTGALSGKVEMSYTIPMAVTRSDYTVDWLQLTFASPVQMFVDQNQHLCVRCELPDDQGINCVGCGKLRFTGHLVPAD